MVGDKASVTHAEASVIASSRSRGGEVGSEEVHFENSITVRGMPADSVEVHATVVEHELVL